MELLSQAVPVMVLIFVLSSMLAMGLGLTFREILAPLRNGRLVILALLANFVIMPVGALTPQARPTARFRFTDTWRGRGLPTPPKLTALARGDLASAVALMVLLTIVTIVYVPLVLPLLLGAVSVDSLKIARSLVLLMMLPLGVSLVVRARLAGAAVRALPWLEKLSTLSSVLLLV